MASTPPLESEAGADSLDDALADAESAVAVVADPFAGRESVLDEATTPAATRTRLAPDDSVDALPAFGDAPLVVDDCHHLYARHVGGFDPLDAFLDRLADRSAGVVTSWNRYSWHYLDAVHDLSAAFGHVFAVPSLSPDRIAAAIRERETAMPTFELPPDHRNSPVRSVEFSVPVPWRDAVSVRVPVVDVDYVDAWLRGGTQPTAEELCFERLHRLSRGNPGVAAAVWAACVEGETLAPSALELPVEQSVDPGDDAAAVLGVAVAKGAVTRAELAAVVPDAPLNRTCRLLADRGFVTDGDVVRLRPAGLPSALESLERRRWLW